MAGAPGRADRAARPSRRPGHRGPLTSRASRASCAARRLMAPTRVVEAPGREALAVGAERQRLDQLGARLEILAMGGADQLRMADDELLEAGPLRHAPAEQQRARARRRRAADARRDGSGSAGAAYRHARGRSSVPHRNGSVERRDRKWEDPSCAEGSRREFPYRAGGPARTWHLAGSTPVGCRGFNGPVPPPLLISISSVVRAMVPHRSRDGQGTGATRVRRSSRRAAARGTPSASAR